MEEKNSCGWSNLICQEFIADPFLRLRLCCCWWCATFISRGSCFMHGICEKLPKLKIGKEKPKLVHGFVVRIFFFLNNYCCNSTNKFFNIFYFILFLYVTVLIKNYCYYCCFLHPTWYPILWVLCELLCIDDMSYLLSMYGIFWSWFDVIFFLLSPCWLI